MVVLQHKESNNDMAAGRASDKRTEGAVRGMMRQYIFELSCMFFLILEKRIFSRFAYLILTCFGKCYCIQLMTQKERLSVPMQKW